MCSRVIGISSWSSRFAAKLAYEKWAGRGSGLTPHSSLLLLFQPHYYPLGRFFASPQASLESQSKMVFARSKCARSPKCLAVINSTYVSRFQYFMMISRSFRAVRPLWWYTRYITIIIIRTLRVCWTKWIFPPGRTFMLQQKQHKQKPLRSNY